LNGTLKVEFLPHCDRQTLKNALKVGDFDIVYFSGHGYFDSESGELQLEIEEKKDSVLALEFCRLCLPSKNHFYFFSMDVSPAKLDRNLKKSLATCEKH
jgi:hypothetical protein|tara:strand:- start:201 stop:497 length:297 start_codon:yes stop_codon:yes gene_type:complete